MNLVEDDPCLHQRRKRKGESVKILAPRNLTWVSTRRKRKGEPVKILAPRNLTWITIRRKRKGESVKILAPRYLSNSSCYFICCTFSELIYLLPSLSLTPWCGKALGDFALINLDSSMSYLKRTTKEKGGVMRI
ncbi:uncharacterized protein LOC122070648 [Macadamia integrifolia]|uniref:uncharacterized protein LOC122070648 n=1 Tax=Macadamia integrifolia TaxID=60698 RepID=UPI001C4E82F7|nr:uncharacterized protein LOC122070648 [Macadamia integrifolia]XP_042490771.1 uncharacterized protein LOC122070648 [Macadamia integrifolia]XP_042490772.1 uncharacterized protein LOC122070648 [Macadamia integrifolia]